jgi:maleylacetate reductase
LPKLWRRRSIASRGGGLPSRQRHACPRDRHSRPAPPDAGNRLAGVCAKIGAHTPRTEVVVATNTAREASADLIVTLGGDSVTDAAKMVGLCLANAVTDPSQLDHLRAQTAADGTTRRTDIKAPSVRSITIPTTLSAGEYTASAGCTNKARHVKESYGQATTPSA